MKVREIMKAPVISASPDLPVEEAFEILKKRGIRHLPVIDDEERLVGIVSDKDLRQALVPAERIDEKKRYFYFKNLVFIKDVMTKDPISIRPDTDIEQAAYIMYTKKIGSLIVLENRRIVGILTSSDFLLLLIGILGMIKEGLSFTLEENDKGQALTTTLGTVSNLGGQVLSVAVKGLENAKRPLYRFRVRMAPEKRPELIRKLEAAGLHPQTLKEEDTVS